MLPSMVDDSPEGRKPHFTLRSIALDRLLPRNACGTLFEIETGLEGRRSASTMIIFASSSSEKYWGSSCARVRLLISENCCVSTPSPVRRWTLP